MKTLEGAPMTADATTERVGSALRIAPGFIATHVNDETQVQTTIEARYVRAQGRYVVHAAGVRTLSDAVEANGDTLRQINVQRIVQAAAPQCIALTLSDEPAAEWLTVSDISSVEGRLIPRWMAEQAVKRGRSNDARMDVVEIVYGAAALSASAPIKAVARELNVPHRTAAVWVSRARDEGRLEGMSYIVGRQADG